MWVLWTVTFFLLFGHTAGTIEGYKQKLLYAQSQLLAVEPWSFILFFVFPDLLALFTLSLLAWTLSFWGWTALGRENFSWLFSDLVLSCNISLQIIIYAVAFHILKNSFFAFFLLTELSGPRNKKGFSSCAKTKSSCCFLTLLLQTWNLAAMYLMREIKELSCH